MRKGAHHDVMPIRQTETHIPYTHSLYRKGPEKGKRARGAELPNRGSIYRSSHTTPLLPPFDWPQHISPSLSRRWANHRGHHLLGPRRAISTSLAHIPPCSLASSALLAGLTRCKDGVHHRMMLSWYTDVKAAEHPVKPDGTRKIKQSLGMKGRLVELHDEAKSGPVGPTAAMSAPKGTG